MPPRRWHFDLLWITACGLVLASGCASTPLGQRFARGEREPVITEQTRPASREREAESSSKKSEKTPAQSPPSRRAPAIADAENSSSRSLDPATQMLIDSELKDLPAEERKSWKSYLASVEPARIPHILQARSKGVTPPGMESSTHSTTKAQNESPLPNATGRSISGRNTSRSLDDLNAPDPEYQQISGEESSPSGSPPPAIAIALEESRPAETDPDSSQTALAEVDTSASGKHGFEGMKIWPQGKRGERSFTDRLSSGISPLTPPWSRNTPPPPENPPRTRDVPVAPPEVPAPLETSIRPNPKADYWQDELSKLISLMEAEASRPPKDDSPAERQAHIQRQVYLRMLYLMAAEPEKAQLPITDAEAVDQEFWTSMFWGMSNYFDDEQTADPGTRAAQTIAQLNAAARQLQLVADLELRSVGFCRRIDGWGLYERFDHDEFEPGQAVLLYGELRNFSTDSTASGMYRSLVSSTIEIVRTGQEDQVLERNDLGDTEDLCRGLRTDFYNSYRIDIPTHLTPGSYQLRLTIEDKLSGRFATQTIGFTVR